MTASPVWAVAGGVRIAIRLTPKAARDRIDGLVADGDGGWMLKVGVTAVPENGKANTALIKLLAKAWRLPRTDMEIVLGATDRRKIVHVTGEPGDLLARLEEWMATLT